MNTVADHITGIYSFNTGQEGLTFIGFGIGVLLAVPAQYSFDQYIPACCLTRQTMDQASWCKTSSSCMCVLPLHRPQPLLQRLDLTLIHPLDLADVSRNTIRIRLCSVSECPAELYGRQLHNIYILGKFGIEYHETDGGCHVTVRSCANV